MSHHFGAVPVLRDVSLVVSSGELVSVLGPSGAGKTTLLRAVGGFVVPNQGEIVLGGATVTNEHFVSAHQSDGSHRASCTPDYQLAAWQDALAPQVMACTICMKRPADFLAVPCGHQCGCGECLAEVKATTNECPICRAPITSLQRVFQSGLAEELQAPAVVGKLVPSEAQDEAGKAAGTSAEDLFDRVQNHAQNKEEAPAPRRGSIAAVMNAMVRRFSSDADTFFETRAGAPPPKTPLALLSPRCPAGGFF